MRENISLRDSIVVMHDTVFTARLQYDSTSRDHYHSVIAVDSVIFIRDSVVHYRYKLKHDSIYVSIVDTVYRNSNTRTVHTVYRTPWYMKGTLCLCALLTLLLLLYNKTH